MKNLTKVSTSKKVLFVGLGILATGIVVLAFFFNNPNEV
jgi:hypothetical protein